jgi:flagellar basal-body rod protein FlgF
MGMIEIASAILSRAQGRVDVASQNIANMTTPGYKSRRQFFEMIDADKTQPWEPRSQQTSVDFTPGKLQTTGNTSDFAIQGRGFFVVRAGNETLYTRRGQFTRDADGHLVTADGAVLQSNGGDVTVGTGTMSVLADGTVMQDGQPGDRIAVADFADTKALEPAQNGLFKAHSGAALDMAAPQIRQGMVETSNVSTAEEMVTMMAALRSAESGQKMVQVYDDLMGRAITSFGGN